MVHHVSAFFPLESDSKKWRIRILHLVLKQLCFIGHVEGIADQLAIEHDGVFEERATQVSCVECFVFSVDEDWCGDKSNQNYKTS